MNKKFTKQEAMGLAIKEAEKGYGFISPNPPVGCVILDKNYRFLSSGFYSHYSSTHAEISAINKIQDKRRLTGSHFFVTLEPCVHFGKNPPCVDSLLKYDLGSLTYGKEDPNPKVKGKGLRKLKQKGVKVQSTSFWQNNIRRLYEVFTLNMEENRTFFALKVASSLDGVCALSHGESQWITSKKSREYGHDLRAEFSAVLIGVQTFLEDNPKLNCRKKGLEKITNKVCILDPSGVSLKLIPYSCLAKVRSMENIYVITNRIVKNKNYPFKVLSIDPCPSNSLLFDLKSLSLKLYQEQIPSVLIEGGAKTFSSFLEQQAAQRVYQFISPCLLGGGAGKHWTSALSIKALNLRKNLKFVERIPLGKDILITGVL